VLVALLIDANRVVSLDRLADVLWPGGGVQSTGSLPVYIANLRRLVEPDRPARAPAERILTRAPGYLLQLGPGEYDAADFEALAAEGNNHLAEARPRAARRALGDALALWRSRPLEEFPFAEREAERLESLRIAATEDRLEADLLLGAHTAVVAELESLAQEYGLRERLAGLLMLALYRSGRQTEALRAYTAARTFLDEQLGLQPGRDLRRLEAAILEHSPELDWHPPAEDGVPAVVDPPRPAAPAVPPPDPFFGRIAELAALDDALLRLGDGPGALVLVSGEPGIGKTRLVQEAVGRAEARGCAVAWGRCEEGDGAPPFWPWIQVVRSLLALPDTQEVRTALGPSAAELAQIVPEVKDIAGEVGSPPPLDPAGARHRFFEAVAGFLGRLSDVRPVAVVLDDLHWADPPSLELTAHLARRVPRLKSLLVATYRDVDPPPDDRLTAALAILARLPGRLVLSLEGLSQEDVAAFIGYEAGAQAPAGVVAAVWARAAGNPFFVGELTRLLVAENGLTEAAATSAGVPWAVRQVVERRLARLPAGTRQLLLTAAVAGQDFDLRVVAVAAAVALPRALDLVDLAVAAGVLREHPDMVESFAFSHALVQETVYGAATQLRRAGLHGLVADALEQLHGDLAPATEVARHRYAAVPVTGPAPAITAALRAAQSAQDALAHEVAEDHLRRAVALAGTMPPGPERDRTELHAQDHLAILLTMVRGVADPQTASAWERATDLARAVDDQQHLLASLWGLLSFSWASGDLAGARSLGENILRLGEASGDPVVTAAAHLGLGSVALCCGDLAGGTGHLVAGKVLADAVPDHLLAEVTYADLRVQVDSWLGMACHLRARHDDGRRLCDAAVARARTLGLPFTTAIALAFAIFGRVLDDADEEAYQLAQELLDQSGTHQLADFAFHARVARVWTGARRAGGTEGILVDLGLLPGATDAGIRPWRPFWLALTAESWHRLGRPEEACRLLEEAFAEVYRLRGDFLGASPPAAPGVDRRAAALVDLREAVRRGTEQGAVVYVERAEASIARMDGTGA
jgi:DNA-binding SARP family transcriptional activator